MSVKRVLINSIWFGVIPKLSTVINVLMLPFITPYLSPEDYGVWGLISSYVGIALSVASLGLFVHLTNFYYEYKSHYNLAWSRLLYLILVASAVVAAVTFILLFFSFDNFSVGERTLLCMLAVVPILFDANGLLAKHIFPLRNKPKPLVLRNLVASLAGICSSFISIYFFRIGFYGFVIGLAVASLMNFILFIDPIWIKEKIVPKRDHSMHRIKEWISISLPAIPHALGFLFLTSSSRIVMNFYGVSINDIGIYTNGYTIGDYVNVGAAAVVTAFLPQLQLAYRQNRFNDFRKLYFFSQGISIFAIVFAVIWMPDLYRLLIRNPQFHEGIRVAQYACFANAVFPLYVFLSSVCFIEKNTKQLLWLVFVPGILNVMLCIICIPIWGYRAALFTTIFSYWTQVLIPFFVKFYNHTVKLWMPQKYQLLLLLLTLSALLVLSNMLSQINTTYKFIVSIALLGLLCNFLKNFAKYKVL
jgi:O-antigen/teichoic acid export membrane protein